MLTREQLLRILKEPDLTDRWLQPLNEAFQISEITEPEEIAAFLANASHETRGFRVFQENLSYSSAHRILEVYPHEIKPSEANHFIHNPAGLANRVYAGRLGNGPETSGDGYKYRGRGIFQITGRHNYTLYGTLTGIPILKAPDLLLVPHNSAQIAASYWSHHDLGQASFEEVVRAINGPALLGLQSRKLLFDSYKKILGVPQ